MAERISPHEAIRDHIEQAQDWEYQEIASRLYGWTDRFNEEFFDGSLDHTLLGFERMRIEVLGGYRLGREEHGLENEITLNTRYLERPLWSILETLLHEQVHLWQQTQGEHPVTRNYHNTEFVSKCEKLGLHPMIGSGVHARPADGRFEELLLRYGIDRPPEQEEPRLDPAGKPINWWEEGRTKKGRSTLTLWTCECEPPQRARVGKQEFFANCPKCESPFKKNS